MTPPAEPPFVDRRLYRRRRLMDAARLLPVLGAVLFALPVLNAAAPEGASTARTGLFLFAVWGGLVLVAGVLSRALAGPEGAPPGPQAAPDDRPPPPATAPRPAEPRC
ncbi:hypothetical protein E2L08_08805 [Palleronia sediminis]|uniref:Uncharacterized protein n=1 Tax=Palleronia sediminis TaxID=2547833 RepID=A0A4R6AAD4_9RHOB|nr:hypothetical protein [Palleronia sediminis]TDL79694.1 hypothetical protein E2L08_08805 [Palleronia sediminis]